MLPYPTLASLASPSPPVPTAPPQLVSTLPDDPAFAPIIADFVALLWCKIERMEDAARRSDAVSLAALGHWLKGTGVTLGFPKLGQAGAELEKCAARTADGERIIAQIRALAGAIVVPEGGSAR